MYWKCKIFCITLLAQCTTNFLPFFTEKVDREGGKPLEITVKRLDNEGFFARQEWGYANFIAPCVYRASTEPLREEDKDSITSEKVNA